MKKSPKAYSVGSYVTGFLLCLALTFLSYWSVVNDVFSGTALLYWIGWLALIQFFVQMLFFLHLGRETKPRWKLVAFWFMTLIVVVLVFGSLWIMTNLDYHHADHRKSSDSYIIHDEGFNQ